MDTLIFTGNIIWWIALIFSNNGCCDIPRYSGDNEIIKFELQDGEKPEQTT